MSDNIKLAGSWKQRLEPEFNKPYMMELRSFLVEQFKNGRSIYPKGSEFFLALNLTPLEKVKVVILGQDPYHGPNQAHGLSFSVKPGVKAPPSLVNIYKELQQDVNFTPPNHGFLESWAAQGVLLLNSVLSVEAGKAASHRDQGWEDFTDRIISILNEDRQNIAFLLWGSYAQKKGRIIHREKHLVIESPHPSPLSAYRGFFGSKPFSKINRYLVGTGQDPICWDLPTIH